MQVIVDAAASFLYNGDSSEVPEGTISCRGQEGRRGLYG